MSDSILKVDEYGRKVWRNKDGQLHRLDGPAYERADGNKYWYQNNRLHRLDGPAYERADGSKYWYQNGKLHRLDGPACEYANGDKYWYRNGKLHRLDGPAYEYANGDKAWYQDGHLHRLDGPAVEFANGGKEWFQNGKQVYYKQATIHLLKTKKTSHCGTRVHKSTVDLFLSPSYNYEEYIDQACKACWLLWRAEP